MKAVFIAYSFSLLKGHFMMLFVHCINKTLPLVISYYTTCKSDLKLLSTRDALLGRLAKEHCGTPNNSFQVRPILSCTD